MHARIDLLSAIVLLSTLLTAGSSSFADGPTSDEIAERLAIPRQKASRWRKRFLQLGVAGLEKDAPRSRRLRLVRPSTLPATARRLRVADLVRDRALLPTVQAEAQALLERDPEEAERVVDRWLGSRQHYAEA